MKYLMSLLLIAISLLSCTNRMNVVKIITNADEVRISKDLERQLLECVNTGCKKLTVADFPNQSLTECVLNAIRTGQVYKREFITIIEDGVPIIFRTSWYSGCNGVDVSAYFVSDGAELKSVKLGVAFY